MRQRRTKVEGEEHRESEFDDIPREKRLTEFSSLPPYSTSLASSIPQPHPPPSCMRMTGTCRVILGFQ